MKLFEKFIFLGFSGFIRLASDFFKTHVFYSKFKAKVIRFPFELNGRRGVVIRPGLSTGRYCKIESYCKGSQKALKIGRNCHLNDSVHIVALSSVEIGDDVLIASKVFITDLNHGEYSTPNKSDPLSIVANRALSSRPVKIGNNVWIGESVSILPGVYIGDNCIVGANSVVTKSFENNSIIAGNPARVIKSY